MTIHIWCSRKTANVHFTLFVHVKKVLLTLSYTVSKSHANFPKGLPVVSFTSTAKVNSSKVKKASPSPSNKLNTFWVKSATSALSRTWQLALRKLLALIPRVDFELRRIQPKIQAYLIFLSFQGILYIFRFFYNFLF